MSQLRQDYDKFINYQAEIVVVGPESQTAFARYWEREKLPFVGLPDPDHQVANLYGQQVKLLKLGRLPALIVIDKYGRICYQHYGGLMADIVPNAEILSVLKDLGQQDV